MDISISLCMLAYDSREAVVQALSELSSVVCEAVVVDCTPGNHIISGPAIEGARLYPKPATEDQAMLWNYCISKATGDWVLVLHPQERVAKGELSILKHLAVNNSFCFEFLIRHYSREWEQPLFISSSGEYPEYEMDYPGYLQGSSVRLFPNFPGIFFSSTPRLGVEASLKARGVFRVARTRIPIHHYPNKRHRDRQVIESNCDITVDTLGEMVEQQNKQEWLGLFEEGLRHFHAGRLSQSISAFLESTALKPDHAPTWLNAGSAFLEMGHFEEAIEKIAKAIELDESRYEAHSNLGVAYLRKGDYDNAEACFRKSLDLNPRHLFSHTNLGATLMHKSMPLEAANAFVQALKLLPQSGSIKADLGAALLAANLAEEARTYLEEAVEDEPRLCRAYYNLALALKMLGRNIEAAKAFDRYCEVEEQSNPQGMSPAVRHRLEMAKKESEEIKRKLSKEASKIDTFN